MKFSNQLIAGEIFYFCSVTFLFLIFVPPFYHFFTRGTISASPFAEFRLWSECWSIIILFLDFLCSLKFSNFCSIGQEKMMLGGFGSPSSEHAFPEPGQDSWLRSPSWGRNALFFQNCWYHVKNPDKIIFIHTGLSELIITD